MKKIEFAKYITQLGEPWVAVDVVHVNDTSVRVAKIEGEYHWHVHPNEDEFFFVLKGEIEVEFKEKTVHLKEGEGLLVPKGTPHRSKSKEPAVIMIVEPTRTNTRGVPVREE